MNIEKDPVTLWLSTLSSNKREFNFSQITDIEQDGENSYFVEVIDERVNISEYLNHKRDELRFIAETHADGSWGYSANEEYVDCSVNIIGHNAYKKEKMLVYIDSPRMGVVSDNNESDSEFWSYGISYTVNIIALSSLHEHALKECLFNQHQ
mgnify:CR=1 FL=1|tara:strand:+ start:1864 stop:2319 length:456 start_codon:yes stop_codon:yes gene_type:complete